MAEKSNLEWKNLHFDGIKKKWDDSSIEIIRDMCEVWDNSHNIIICHPNCVFAEKPVSKDKREFNEIDWQDVAKEFSCKCNNSNSYISYSDGCDESFKYIHRRFRHELFSNKKLQQPRHLAIVELDGMGGSLVRGIFKATEKSLMVAENPLYAKYKPKSIWDKSLRWTADDIKSLEEFISNEASVSKEPRR